MSDMPDRPPPAELDYGKAAPARTKLGRLALVAALLYHIPIQLLFWIPRMGLPLSKRVEQNLSNFIFDFGFAVDVFLLLLCIVGLIQPGGRRAALLALAVVVLGSFLMLTG
jgi:hypothetical protein